MTSTPTAVSQAASGMDHRGFPVDVQRNETVVYSTVDGRDADPAYYGTEQEARTEFARLVHTLFPVVSRENAERADEIEAGGNEDGTTYAVLREGTTVTLVVDMARVPNGPHEASELMRDLSARWGDR